MLYNMSEMMLDDQLSKKIRKGEITPEDALQLLKDDKVLVYDLAEIAPEDATWANVEDLGAGASDIQRSLRLVGASDQADAFSAEVARLRAAGLTMESLWSKTDKE